MPFRRRAPFFAAAVLAILLTAFALSAEPSAAAVSLDVEAGYANGYVPGRPVPVRITIEADRLLRGRLVVTLGVGDEVRTEQAVEVSGGALEDQSARRPLRMSSKKSVMSVMSSSVSWGSGLLSQSRTISLNAPVTP